MLISWTVFFSVLLITTIIILIVTILNKREMNSRLKNAPFECGFDPMNSARLPFSIRFFLLAIIFLIFDIEIALLFPLVISNFVGAKKIYYITGIIFLTILLGGLYHEWNQGTLAWVN